MGTSLISYASALFEHPELLALMGLVIAFPATTQALEEPALETITAGNEPLLIKVLTVSNDEATQEVINHRLDDTDFVNNFRINVLADYPELQHILNAASISDIRQAIDTEIPQADVGVGYIMYDNEEWDSTPAEEQRNPARSTDRAADVVHAAGYGFAVSPSRKLLVEELDEIDWRKVQLLVVQTQKLVGTPEFKDMTYKISSTVRSENPNCIVMIQVNPSLNTVDQIVDAVDGVRAGIDGVSIVWNRNDPGTLDELIVNLKQ
jgi:hypothetical protein